MWWGFTQWVFSDSLFRKVFFQNYQNTFIFDRCDDDVIKFWCFLWYAYKQTVEQTIGTPAIWTTSRSLWRYCNGSMSNMNAIYKQPSYLTLTFAISKYPITAKLTKGTLVPHFDCGQFRHSIAGKAKSEYFPKSGVSMLNIMQCNSRSYGLKTRLNREL